MRRLATIGLAVLIGAAAGRTLNAQTPSGPIASAAFAAAVMDSETSGSISGFVGYRFNRVLGMGMEISWIPDGITGDDRFPFRRPDEGGDVVTFTTNVRLEVPTTSPRVLPFVVGGGGVASIRREYFGYPLLPFDTLPAEVFSFLGTAPELQIYPPPVLPAYTDTTTGLALTLGGGASFALTRHLSADVDVRYLYIRANPSESIGRFGAGISARF